MIDEHMLLRRRLAELEDRVGSLERQSAAALRAFESMAGLLTEMVEAVTGESVDG
jgi:hypothetical protein